jgi:hypothetical protein
MMLLSFILSRKHYPIKYDLPKIFFYLGMAFGLYFLSAYIELTVGIVKYAVHSLMLIGFAIIIYLIERPKKVVI